MPLYHIAVDAVPLLEEEAKKQPGWRGTYKAEGSIFHEDPKRPPFGGHASRAVQMAAKEAQVGVGTVQRAIEVKRRDPQLFGRIRRGEITVGADHCKSPVHFLNWRSLSCRILSQRPVFGFTPSCVIRKRISSSTVTHPVGIWTFVRS